MFGQILGGLARLHRATGDAKPAAKALRLLDGWAACIEPDGYGLQNPRGKIHDPYYEYEKLCGGLVDCHEYLGSAKALACLAKLTDWAIPNLDPAVAKQPGDPTDGREWYTLSENLYRAFLATGDERYRDFAKVWEYPYYWNKFLDPAAFASPKKHAYSHVNTLSGAAMAYRATGEKRYLDIIRNAYDLLAAGYLYATGGYGPCEKLFGDPGYLGESVLHAQDDGWGHMEITCSTWAVFKLSRYLLEFTGDARYADWAEKVLYNCMAAELPIKPGGKIQYYADYYVLGARKCCDDGRTVTSGVTFEWPCCTGTLPGTVAEYANLAWFTGPDGVRLSQYVPSRLRWNRAGTDVELSLDTAYPEEETARISVKARAPVEFTLRLRKPAWADAIAVSVNGRPVAAETGSDGWFAIARTWKTGDTVEVRIPLGLRFLPVDGAHPGIVALACGPVVLASDASGIMAGDPARPDDWIAREPGRALHFTTAPGKLKVYPNKIKRFKPLYEFSEGETYFCYNRIDAAEGPKGTLNL